MKIRKNKAFTLAEILIVLVIIGILAVLMLVSMGNNIDKNKGLFKKAYSVTERTVVELVNNETYYPYNFDKFGFLEDSNVKIVGADICTNTDNYNSSVTNCSENKTTGILLKFCNLFANNINLSQNPKFPKDEKDGTTDYKKCTFKSNDGVDWTIVKVTTSNSPINGFLVKIDVDGNDKGINKPEKSGDIEEDQGVRNRDKFYMFVRYDGKILLPEKDNVAKNHLKSHNLNREN